MARDPGLEQRVEELLPEGAKLERKAMFGGLAFLDRGNLCFGLSSRHMLVRVGKDGSDEALQRPNARTMVMRGKEMVGWVQVDPPGYEADSDLQWWMAKGIEFAATLPPK
jgi:hypothetical protein